MSNETILFIPANRALGNVVRDILIADAIAEIRPDLDIFFLAPVSSRIALLQKEFRYEFFPLERVKAARKIADVIFSGSVSLAVCDQAYQAPLLLKMAESNVVLIAQPFPIMGQDFSTDKYRRGLEVADSILIPMLRSFLPIPKELKDLSSKIKMIGPILKPPAETDRKRLRAKLGIQENFKVILATAGGGYYGLPILENSLMAFKELLNSVEDELVLIIHAGPLLSMKSFQKLQELADSFESYQLRIIRYVPSLTEYIAASDLMISHAGNVIFEASLLNTPKLIIPPPLLEHMKIAMRMKELGAAEILLLWKESAEKLFLKLHQLLYNEELREEIIAAGKKIVDGKAINRASENILSFL